MAQLTKEQYERLKDYEKELISAYKRSFLHMSGSDFLKVAEVYNEVFGEPLSKSQMGCNTCRLNALRKLGELYANFPLKDEKKETKRGRPKKLEEKKDE